MKACNASLQIPIEYDTVAYHLPFVVEWFQTGSLNHLYYSAFAGPISYYPSNYELLDLWTFLPFKNDLFANLLNFTFFPILAGFLWKIFRNFNIDKKTALVATALPFYMQIFLHQAGIPLVDLFFITLFTSSLYFIQEILLMKNKSYTNFLLCGLSLGLFMGTKYIGLVYGLVLVFLLIGIVWHQAKARETKFLKAAWVSLLGVLLTGSFFYIRNWINAGNPLFPVEVSFLGVHFFEGYEGSNVQEYLTTTSLLANFTTIDSIKNFVHLYFFKTGPYGILSIALPPILLCTAFVIYFWNKLLKKRKLTHQFWMLSALALGTMLYFYLYIKAPYTERDLLPNIRYSLPFLIMGSITIGYFASMRKMLRKAFLLSSVLFCAYSFTQLIISSPELIPSTGRFLVDYALLWEYKVYVLFASIFCIFLLSSLVALTRSIERTRKAKCRYLFLVSVLFLTSSIGFALINFAHSEREVLMQHTSEYWLSDEYELKILNIVEAAEWLDSNAVHAKVAYTGFNYHYHLFGRDLSREVDYVNINDCTNCRYIDYKDSEGSIRRDPSYEDWYENLKSQEKEYLVVNPVITEEVWNYEFEWINENPEHFEQVFNLNDIYIYKISYD